MAEIIRKLLTEEQGQGTTEYGLILGIISIAVIGLLGALSTTIIEMFQKALTDLQSRPD
ncbi:Flp family type IVb pilin [Calidifontibacillus oryziterrae]|uniref:Flp family type IVb pilin n=1 Tax=Calidifontibacillus oryziterrae TaxID=1191699 RepID=UPI0002F9FDA1|nr:Flp family type IVb pilin [Calidifontibacillus oryziterrae]